jgi:hypothetical protein
LCGSYRSSLKKFAHCVIGKFQYTVARQAWCRGASYSHVLSQLNDERDARNSTRIIFKNERIINEGDTNQNWAHVLALQDDMDGKKLNFHLLSEENEMLAEEKDAAISDVSDVRRQNNHVSGRQLNNPDMNGRRKYQVVTMRERLNHILTHDAREER